MLVNNESTFWEWLTAFLARNKIHTRWELKIVVLDPPQWRVECYEVTVRDGKDQGMKLISAGQTIAGKMSNRQFVGYRDWGHRLKLPIESLELLEARMTAYERIYA